MSGHPLVVLSELTRLSQNPNVKAVSESRTFFGIGVDFRCASVWQSLPLSAILPAALEIHARSSHAL